MASEIEKRIDRLYAALGRVVERNFESLPAKQVRTPKGFLIHQDFSGGQSEAEMSEALHSLIANIASFHDHLQEWGKTHGVSQESIHNYFDSSPDFPIVWDLWTVDKHGGTQRRDGWSKKAPRLGSVRRVLELRTGPQANSVCFMTAGRDGRPKIGGNGDPRTVLTAEVVDKLGNGLGETHEFIERALQLCEAAISKFGVT